MPLKFLEIFFQKILHLLEKNYTMIISEEEKNRIRKIHRANSIIKEVFSPTVSWVGWSPKYATLTVNQKLIESWSSNEIKETNEGKEFTIKMPKARWRLADKVEIVVESPDNFDLEKGSSYFVPFPGKGEVLQGQFGRGDLMFKFTMDGNLSKALDRNRGGDTSMDIHVIGNVDEGETLFKILFPKGSSVGAEDLRTHD